jgi:cytochrome c1
MRKTVVALVIVTVIAFAALSCQQKEEPATGSAATTTGPAPATPAAPIRLDQGWTEAEAETFYYTPQGSQLIPYPWFRALEVEDGQSLFHDDANMARYGYITASGPTPQNPDALPVGFVIDSGTNAPLLTHAQGSGSPATQWLGMTCAACHTAELHHGGKRFRIDGGPAMADHESLIGAMARSLEATQHDDAKFTRFAQRVLGPAYNADGAGKLKADLSTFTTSFRQAAERNRAPVAYGFARLDAFGAIFNQVTEVALNIPANHAPSDAPVSFPFLWDAPQLDWVQWNGSVNNALGRNVGEVMGVYGNFTLDPGPQQFASSVHILNLDKMEQQLAKLTAPKWPEAEFGAIDNAKAEAGRQLYARTCATCHSVRDAKGNFKMTPPNQFGKQFVWTAMIPLEEIGTDPKMVQRFTRMVDPGALRSLMNNAPKAPAAAVLAKADGGVILRSLAALQPQPTQQQVLAMTGFHDPNGEPPNPIAYKARPLDGIWATAPYLHAGSVPNLYQLLLPAKQRVTTFHVGSREFDPKDVGFSTQPFPGSFEFRTSEAGNSNAGHDGLNYTQVADGGKNRDFTEAERRALIEYMKTLR